MRINKTKRQGRVGPKKHKLHYLFDWSLAGLRGVL